MNVTDLLFVEDALQSIKFNPANSVQSNALHILSLTELVVAECFHASRNLFQDFGYGKLKSVFAIIWPHTWHMRIKIWCTSGIVWVNISVPSFLPLSWSQNNWQLEACKLTNACISYSLGYNGCQSLTGFNCVTKSTLNENTLLRPKVITRAVMGRLRASWSHWDGTWC